MSDFVEQWVELSENKLKWWKQIVLELFIETVIIFWYILSTEWGVVLYFFSISMTKHHEQGNLQWKVLFWVSWSKY